MDDLAHDLAAFITAAPTPYHAVGRGRAPPDAAGFVEQPETGPWLDGPGGRYLVRDGTFAAWVQGAGAPAAAGATSRTPTRRRSRSSPTPTPGAAGWRQVGRRGLRRRALELLARPRPRPRRAASRSTTARPCSSTSHRPLLRVPQLAIHLDREVNQGLTLDAQQHLMPIWGLGAPAEGDLRRLPRRRGRGRRRRHRRLRPRGARPHPAGPPRRASEELLAAPRLDNLASVHAGLGGACVATLDADPVTPVVIGFDHEEIGSATATGAAGPLLENLLTRLAGGFDARGPAFAASRCLSADVTHAAHPNYLERHEPGHRPLPNRGPALKVNANPALRHRRPRRRRLVPRLPHRGRPDAGVRREEHDARAARRSGRSPPPGSASARSTSASRCCPCTPPGSCAGWPIRVSSPPRPRRSSATRADARLP